MCHTRESDGGSWRLLMTRTNRGLSIVRFYGLSVVSCRLSTPARQPKTENRQREALVRRNTHRRHRSAIELAGSNAIDVLHWQNENLAVPDIASARAIDDRVHGRFDEVIGHADVEAHLVGQLHLHRRAAISLHALDLAAVPLDAADGQAGDLRAKKRFENVRQPFRPDDRHNEFHWVLLALTRPSSAASRHPSTRCARSGQALLPASRGEGPRMRDPRPAAAGRGWPEGLGEGFIIPSSRRAAESLLRRGYTPLRRAARNRGPCPHRAFRRADSC